MKVPLTRPHVDEEDWQAIREVLESGWLAQGPKTRTFEEKFAEYLSVKHAVATTSCTTALELSLLSLDISSDDEVIVPDFTFPATGNAVYRVGARPVLVDVDPSTYNLTAESVRPVISKRTRAVVVVHLFGHPADMEPIQELARAKDIAIVEDAACSVGATYQEKKVGALGDAACFSFHPRKIMTTGEGGMLVTNNDELAERARMIRNHGARTKNGVTTFEMAGTNFRLSDLQAALGLAQLRKLDSMIAVRRKLAHEYAELLSGTREFMDLPKEERWAFHTYQSYVAVVRGLPRDEVISHLRNEFEIETQIGTYALHMQPSYARLRTSGLAVSEALYNTTLTLPLFHDMTAEQQRYVCDSLAFVMKQLSGSGAIAEGYRT